VRRYRVLSMDFDKRAYVLSLEIKDTWEPKVKDLWEGNKRRIAEMLVAEYGAINFHRKIGDFISLGNLPFSVVSFHNNFLRQAQNAFVIGGYYPCLTASCALVERILNQLVLRLREHYRNTKEYKRVCRKDSFDDWSVAIDVLEAWGVFAPGVSSHFRELRDIRNKALHFNPETDRNCRDSAIQAFRELCIVIEKQFGASDQPWFIDGTKGVSFIRKDSEGLPFVKEIVIPNCAYVGYLHTLDMKDNKWIVRDDNEYKNIEITDDKFRELFNARSEPGSSPQ
jgi:hypothetical protein